MVLLLIFRWIPLWDWTLKQGFCVFLKTLPPPQKKETVIVLQNLPRPFSATSFGFLHWRSPYMWLYKKRSKQVKWSRYRPGVAQKVGRGIALLFHDRGTRRRWVVSSTPRPHFIPGKDPVPILQEAEWAPGPVWTGGKSRPHRDSIPVRPARSSVTVPTELPDPYIWLYAFK